VTALTHLWTHILGTRPTRVAFSHPTGNLLVGDRSGNLTCLDRQNQLLWKRELIGEVTGVAPWPERDRVAVGTQDRWLRLLDHKGEALWERELERAIWSVAIDPIQRLIAVGTGDSVGLLEPGGQPRWQKPVGRAVVAVAISQGGRRVAACADQNLFCFDDMGEQLWKEWFVEPLWDVSLSDDGQRVAAGCWDANVYGLDGSGGRLWQGGTGGQVHGVAQEATGRMTLTGGHDGCLRLWGPEGNLLFEKAVEGPVNSVALSPDLRFVACTLQKKQQVQLFELGAPPLGGAGSPLGSLTPSSTSSPTMPPPSAPWDAGTGQPPTPSPPGASAQDDSSSDGEAEGGMSIFDLFGGGDDKPSSDEVKPSSSIEPASSDPAFPSLFGDSAPGSSPTPGSSRFTTPSDETARSQGEQEQAFAKFSDEVERRSVTSQLRLGTAAYDKGLLEQALEHFHLATQADGEEPRGWFNKALVLHRMERPREALQALAEALRVDPEYAPAREASEVLMESYKSSQSD